MNSTLERVANTPYELIGPPTAPVVLVLGGISATHHVTAHADDSSPGWWEEIVGPGRAIDTGAYRVLGVAFSDGGRASGGRPRAAISTHDQAARIVDLLDELDIAQLDAAVGASYGGMVALALAERFPERLRRLVVISAAHESHPMTTGLRAVQRGIVELGLDTDRAADAMALARAIAMTTYRTAREFSQRFATEPRETEHGVEFDVQRYLTRSGQRFAEQMRPERFLALSLSADLHRVVPEQVTVPTTVIAAEGDTLVPPAQSRAMARRLPNLRTVHVMHTTRGHDAFLTEPARLGRLLTLALAD